MLKAHCIMTMSGCHHAMQAIAQSLCGWLKDSTAAKPPLHDETMLVLESMVRRGLLETTVPLSTVMEWRSMQCTEMSNAALRCVAALFMRGELCPAQLSAPQHSHAHMQFGSSTPPSDGLADATGHRSSSQTTELRQQLMEIATSGINPATDPNALGAAICSLIGLHDSYAAARRHRSLEGPASTLSTDTDAFEQRLEQLQRGDIDTYLPCALSEFNVRRFDPDAVSAGEAWITQTACASTQGTQPAAVGQTAWPQERQLLTDAHRLLKELMQTMNERGSDVSAHPGGTGSAPAPPSQLLIACIAMVTCAAAVHAGAQQAGSVVPEQWSADGLADGMYGGMIMN